MTLFRLSEYTENGYGFVMNSTVKKWESWLKVHIKVPEYDIILIKNLAHIMLGLEMKAGLILAQQKDNILYNPYIKILSFEFCVGVFSICEGLGSNRSGSTKKKEWKKALCDYFDSDETLNLKKNIETVIKIRDKIHQDKTDERDHIDYHSFRYEESFQPALELIQSLLKKSNECVPEGTNLKTEL